MRGTHVIADAESRRAKAGKIIAVLGRRRSLVGRRLLEIGCGSGQMTSMFADVVGPTGSVQAVDRVDARRVTEGFAFTMVAGTRLPFDDAQFEFVVSNHVIEHIGSRSDQAHHVRELARVLTPDGLAYLAVPNRWTPMEPHYRLPCLSWLPQRWADRYVRWTRKGDWYDVVPVTPSALATLAVEAGLEPENVTHEVAALTAEREPVGPVTRWVARAPRQVFDLLCAVVPTAAFILRHPPGQRGATDAGSR